MQQFTKIDDVSDPKKLLANALELKSNPTAFSQLGKGKTLGLIFMNPSMRTRLSIWKAAKMLGMEVMIMNMNSEGWKLEFADGAVMDGNTQEHIKEAAGVLNCYCDIIGIRTFAGLKNQSADYAESMLSGFLQNVTVPVISLESAIRHPLQSLADWITIAEHKKTKRPKVVLTWAPHPKPLPQAVANSFVEWMKVADVELTIANPIGYDLAPEFSDGIEVIHNQNQALENADFVYAKSWSSYHDYGKANGPQNWTVTPEKMQLTNNAKFMHCLPVRRNVVVADAVLDGSNSLVLEQASNRVTSAQIVLKTMLEGLAEKAVSQAQNLVYDES